MKWLESMQILTKVIAKRFIATFKTARTIGQLDVDLYFIITEKITVYDGRLVISLLDGSKVECEIE